MRMSAYVCLLRGNLRKVARERPRRLDFSEPVRRPDSHLFRRDRQLFLTLAPVPYSPLKAQRLRHERCVYSPLVCKSSIFASYRPFFLLLPSSFPPPSPLLPSSPAATSHGAESCMHVRVLHEEEEGGREGRREGRKEGGREGLRKPETLTLYPG